MSLRIRFATCRLVMPAVLALSAHAHAASDFSPAEQALFMRNQLATVKPPVTLNYSYRRAGTLEDGFDDTAAMTLRARPDGSCCAADMQFLHGPRQLRLPEGDGGLGNPVILYFLERDIREMERLTRGKQNYFRKRIRMAIYAGASVRQVTYRYLGKDVTGQEIAIAPYLDDPNRARFEKLSDKQYTFMLSEAVPGGVYGIRTRIGNDAGAASPLIVEELLIEGAQP